MNEPRAAWGRGWAAACIVVAFALGLLPALLALADVANDPRDALRALGDGLLYERLARTLGIAAVVIAIAGTVGAVLGWLLVRSDLPGRRLWIALLPLPLFLPPLVHVLGWFGLLGLTGSTALVAIYVVSLGPLCTLTALRAFEQIPREQAEATRLAGGRGALVRTELRQAVPAVLVGAALVLVLLLSDFAVADFLTSVGPKTVVYADSLYAHHVAGRGSAVAAAALPGMVLAGAVLAAALWTRRRLGWAVGMRFAAPEPVELGAWRLPLAGIVALWVGGAALGPFLALAWQAGSFDVVRDAAAGASDRIAFTVSLAAGAATGMVLLAAPLGVIARGLRRPIGLDLLIFAPLAVPALLFGVGLIRQWNHPLTEVVYQGGAVVLIAVVGRYLAVAYLPVTGAMERIDGRLVDAAQLAGAGSFERARRVLLPLSSTALAAAWCWSFAFTLRELDALIMLAAGQRSLTFYLYSNVVFARKDEVAALALVLALVTAAPLVVFLAVSRRSLRLP